METPWFVPPSDFWGRLSAEAREALLACGHRRSYPKGSAVFRAGSPGENIYILMQGRVKIFSLSSAGRGVILWFCFPGEVFGLAEMPRAGRRAVDAEACTDSEVLTVSQAEFKRYLESDARTALLVVDLLACRLRNLGDMMLNLTSDDVTTRVIKLLVRLAARYGKQLESGGIRLDIPLTHQEMADMIGTTRQSVNQTLNSLKRRGLLELSKSAIHIQNGKLLEDLAEAAAVGAQAP
jgi:CRP/FNR family transcriptional regulator